MDEETAIDDKEPGEDEDPSATPKEETDVIDVIPSVPAVLLVPLLLLLLMPLMPNTCLP